jgi:hypothetical protein
VVSGRAAETSGRMQARHRGRFGRKVLVVRAGDAWTVERLNGISRRPEGCKGSNFLDLESV